MFYRSICRTCPNVSYLPFCCCHSVHHKYPQILRFLHTTLADLSVIHPTYFYLGLIDKVPFNLIPVLNLGNLMLRPPILLWFVAYHFFLSFPPFSFLISMDPSFLLGCDLEFAPIRPFHVSRGIAPFVWTLSTWGLPLVWAWLTFNFSGTSPGFSSGSLFSF